MQYAQVIDLMLEARKAGEETTDGVMETLAEAFDSWLNAKKLGDITDEEYDTLKSQFEKGFSSRLFQPE